MSNETSAPAQAAPPPLDIDVLQFEPRGTKPPRRHALQRWASSSITAAVLAGLAIRVVVAIFTHTPHDVLFTFHRVGLAVRQGVDPIAALSSHSWNFLPPMAFIYALLSFLGHWNAVVKIFPIAADLAVVVMLYRIKPSAGWLYALNPIAIIVSAFHGQIDSIALALGFGALVLAPKGKGGLLLGLAIACKSWPVIFLPAVWILSPKKRRTAIETLAVPTAFFLGLLALHADLLRDARVILGYHGLRGRWGWAGLIKCSTPACYADGVGVLGGILTLAAFASIIWLLRKRPIELTLALFMTFLVINSSVGAQYLVWPVPLLILLRPKEHGYMIAASAWAALSYTFPAEPTKLAILSFIPIAFAARELFALLARKPLRQCEPEGLLAANFDASFGLVHKSLWPRENKKQTSFS